MSTVEILEPWNGVAYEDALARQREKNRAGEVGWLLFCCPPTLTIGLRGDASDVLVSREQLNCLGVRVLDVDRGGQVTYHGPGQIIGFPVGSVQAHTGDPRGVRAFVSGLERRLGALVERELVLQGDRVRSVLWSGCQAGVWLSTPHGREKVVAMGLRFAREGIGHGFALNVFSMSALAELINPCGERGARTSSIFAGPSAPNGDGPCAAGPHVAAKLIEVRDRVARVLASV